MPDESPLRSTPARLAWTLSLLSLWGALAIGFLLSRGNAHLAGIPVGPGGAGLIAVSVALDVWARKRKTELHVALATGAAILAGSGISRTIIQSGDWPLLVLWAFGLLVHYDLSMAKNDYARAFRRPTSEMPASFLTHDQVFRRYLGRSARSLLVLLPMAVAAVMATRFVADSLPDVVRVSQELASPYGVFVLGLALASVWPTLFLTVRFAATRLRLRAAARAIAEEATSSPFAAGVGG